MANVVTSIFKKNSEHVEVGSKIQFERKGYQYEGEVRNIREMTVIVAVDTTSVPADLLFENNVTVVNHGKYQIINELETIAG